jgi:hypothetical protein
MLPYSLMLASEKPVSGQEQTPNKQENDVDFEWRKTRPRKAYRTHSSVHPFK